MAFDQAQSARLGQKTPVESTYVMMFSGDDLPEASWRGQLIYRNETQALEIFNGNAWEDVVGGSAGTLTFVGPTIPVSQTVGDIWFDSSDSNHMYRAASIGADEKKAGEWEDMQGAPPIPGAKTFRQDTPPTVASEGDLWFETDNKNKQYYYHLGTWVTVQDGTISDAQTTANSANTLAGTANGTANTALSTANAAQTNASNAQSTANTANTNATTAITTANGKNKTYYATSQPTGGTYVEGDIWFDTANGYKMYRYTSGAWSSVQDSSIAAATAAATGAQGTANSAQTTANAAQATANAANTAVGSKNSTYYQASQPSGGSYTAGDLWFDTAHGYVMYRYQTTPTAGWVNIQDTAIPAAQTTASNAQVAAINAQTTANGKNVSYYTTPAPSGGTYVAGDLWFDTANGYRMSRWSGSAWVSVQDTLITTANTTANNALSSASSANTAAGNAQTTANSKNKITVSATAPAAPSTGDEWIDTANGNVIKVWTGSAWGNYQDTAIAAAQSTANTANSTANTALTSANGKNKVYYASTAPTGGTYIAGDTWFDTANGYRVNNYVVGTGWVAVQYGTNAIANLSITNALIADGTIQNAKIGTVDAGKITTGTLDANRIGAQSITASMILTDTLTATQIAAGAIGASELAAGSVIAGKIAAGVITATEIAANTITAAQIAAGTITATQIATDTITANQIAANAINTSELNAGAVTAAKIATGTITANEISSSYIYAGTLAATQITSGTLAAGRIGANTITADKLSVVVGGGNMWPNSSFSDTTAANPPNWGNASVAADTTLWYRSGRSMKVTSLSATNAFGVGIALLQNADTALLLQPNTKYTVSAMIYNPTASGITQVNCATSGAGIASAISSNPTTVKDAWVRTYQTFQTAASGVWSWTVNTNGNPPNGCTFNIGAVQLELGDVPTAWAAKPDEILPGTIQAGMLSANSVVAGNISAGTVSTQEIDTLWLGAQEINASQINGGQINAGVAIASSLQTVAPDGGQNRVEITALGVTLYDQNNQPEVQLLTDNQATSTFNGTATLSSTTVTGNLTIGGSSNTVAPGSSLGLTGKFGDPTTGPTAQVSWAPGVSTWISGNPDLTIKGLTWCKDNNLWFTTNWYVGTQMLGFDNNGGNYKNLQCPERAPSTNRWFWPRGGAVWSNVGGSAAFYVFGITSPISGAAQTWEIRKFAPDAGYTALTYTSYISKGALSNYQVDPIMCLDQTGAPGYFYYDSTSHLRYAKIDPTTLADVSNVSWPLTSPPTNPTGDGVRNLFYGQVSNDFGLSGANRAYVFHDTSKKMFGFSGGSNTRDTTMDFPTANNAKMAGAWYSGSGSWGGPSSDAFYSIDATGHLFTYANNMWTTESSTWWAAHSYSTGATPTYTTSNSVQTKFTMTKRAQVQLSIPKMPGSGGATDPDTVRFYLGRGTTQPTRTNLFQNPVGTPAVGATQQIIGPPGTQAVFTGNNPPATNTYPAAAPATIADATATTLIDSTGYGVWAPPGTVSMYAGAVAPSGWLLCNGANYTYAQYPALANAIGVTFGGSAGTNFNVPNISGHFPWGAGLDSDTSGTIRALGSTGGSYVMTQSQMPSHYHGTGGDSTLTVSGRPNGPGSQVNVHAQASGAATIVEASVNGHTQTTGSDQRFLPPYIAMNFIIKT